MRDVADSYPNAEIIWCQEEPLNQGPWYHVEPRIVTSLNNSEHHKGKWDLGAGAFYPGRSASGASCDVPRPSALCSPPPPPCSQRLLSACSASALHCRLRLLANAALLCSALLSASTSTGFKYTHITELHNLLADALKPGAEIERVDGGFPVWAK